MCLHRLQLPLAIPRENILVSRLVAARTALEMRSSTVLDELGREFATNTFAEVALALGGGEYHLANAWHEPFAPARFFAMLDRPDGQQVVEDITRQINCSDGISMRFLRLRHASSSATQVFTEARNDFWQRGSQKGISETIQFA